VPPLQAYFAATFHLFTMPSNPPSGQPSAAQIARLIHTALTGGVALFAAAAWFAPGPPPNPDFALRQLVGPVIVVGVVVAVYLRRWLPALDTGMSADAWWAAALPKAIAIWALVEAACLVGCVTVFLTHDRMAMIWIAVGLLAFTLLSPGRLLGSARSTS